VSRATSRRVERLHQQRAGLGALGVHELRDHLKVHPRLIGRPTRVGRRGFEIKAQAGLPRVAHHAGRDAWDRAAAIAHEDGLDRLPERVDIGLARRGAWFCRRLGEYRR
jgi:hypothetical protein